MDQMASSLASVGEALFVDTDNVYLPGEWVDRANLAPPFVYLDAVGQALRGSTVRLGAQDVCAEKNGAYTGACSCEPEVDSRWDALRKLRGEAR